MQQLPTWRSTYPEKWKTKTGFNSTLSGFQGWKECVNPSQKKGAQPFIDGLKIMGEKFVERSRDTTREVSNNNFMISTSKGDWLNQSCNTSYQKKRQTSGGVTYRSFLSARALKQAALMEDSLIQQSFKDRQEQERKKVFTGRQSTNAISRASTARPYSRNSETFFKSKKQSNESEFQNQQTFATQPNRFLLTKYTNSCYSSNRNPKIYKKTLEDVAFKQKINETHQTSHNSSIVQKENNIGNSNLIKQSQSKSILSPDRKKIIKRIGIEDISKFKRLDTIQSKSDQKAGRNLLNQKSTARFNQNSTIDLNSSQNQGLRLSNNIKSFTRTHSPVWNNSKNIKEKLLQRLKQNRKDEPIKQYLSSREYKEDPRKKSGKVFIKAENIRKTSYLGDLTSRKKINTFRQRMSPEFQSMAHEMTRIPSQKSAGLGSSLRPFTPLQNVCGTQLRGNQIGISRSQKKIFDAIEEASKLTK